MTITTDELVAASLSLFTNGVSLFRSIYPFLCVCTSILVLPPPRVVERS